MSKRSKRRGLKQHGERSEIEYLRAQAADGDPAVPVANRRTRRDRAREGRGRRGEAVDAVVIDEVFPWPR